MTTHLSLGTFRELSCLTENLINDKDRAEAKYWIVPDLVVTTLSLDADLYSMVMMAMVSQGIDHPENYTAQVEAKWDELCLFDLVFVDFPIVLQQAANEVSL